MGFGDVTREAVPGSDGGDRPQGSRPGDWTEAENQAIVDDYLAMLALEYCTVLELPVGHLVYARGNEEPMRHVVRGVGVEIACHALDLGAPVEVLLAAVDVLAASIATRSSIG